MRKVLLPLVAIISFGFVNAQSKNKRTIEITPKIGISRFCELNEGNYTESNTGAKLGVTADYYLNNRWSLRSGLIADKMGGKSVIDGYTYEDKFNYLSIPINANWHFGSTRKWNLNFGLNPSFLVSAKMNGLKFPKNTIESFQLGLTYGVGYKIEITNKFGILIDTQFFNGLTNINKATDAYIVNAGYSLNLGGVIQL